MNVESKKWCNRPFANEHLILLLAIVGVLLFQALPGMHPLDDSYITFRYARNIQAGLGFVYNPGEPVQGTTTPLYTLILVLLSFLLGSENLPEISFGIALCADIMNVWLLFRISKYFLKQNLSASLLVIVFLIQPQRLNVAAGGMETSLYITAILGMYDLYLIEKKVLVAAIIGSLAILIRPDAILAVGPVFLHLLWRDRRLAGKAFLLGMLILTPWYVWATMYFGTPIPFSILAKMEAYQNYTSLETLIFILTFLGTGTVGPYKDLLIIYPGLIIVIFLIIIGIRWFWKNDKDSFIIISFPFLYFLIMAIRHVPLFFTWYYLPLIPGLLLLYFGAFQKLGSYLPKKRQIQEICLGSFSLALVIIPSLLMHFLPGWANSRGVENLYHEASMAIHDKTKNKVVFAPDIGVIGWDLEEAKIIDPIGLVSPISLKYIESFRESGRINKEIIKDLKPDFVIAHEGFLGGLIKDSEFLVDYQLIWQKKSSINSIPKVFIYERK